MKTIQDICTLLPGFLRFISGSVFLFIIFNSGIAYAIEASPVQVSIFNPVQLINSDATIYGLRVNLIYGKNTAVYGIDLGLGNYTTHGAGGIQAGIANINLGDLTGIQTGIANVTKNTNSHGLQIGMINMLTGNGEFKGFEIGVVNTDFGSLYGLQFGFFNYTESMYGPQVGFANMADDVAGLQVGAFGNRIFKNMNGIQVSTFINNCENLKGAQLAIGGNVSNDVYGVQIGVINAADRVKGVQIGVINYTKRMSGVQIGVINIITEGMIPVFPIFNASMTF